MPRQRPAVTYMQSYRLERRDPSGRAGRTSRRVVAEATGVDEALVGHIERRMRRCVDLEARARIARFFRQPVAHLFDEIGFAREIPGTNAPPLPPRVYAVPTPAIRRKVVRLARAGKKRHEIMAATSLAVSALDQIRREAGLTNPRAARRKSSGRAR